MQRKPSPRTLAVAFLAFSAALSFAVLAARNLYDDEISSLDTITLPAGAIIRAVSQHDVHPPGMYLLAHFALRLLPSFRWMNIFPLLFFYAGLAIFVLHLTPAFTRIRSQVCFFLLATLHPQLLMWGNSFRWYSWWTGLALATLVVALQPRIAQPRLTAARGIALGLLLGCLFYLNYITLLFAAALAVAMAARYRGQPRRELALSAIPGVLLFVLLIAPQLHTLLVVHLPESGSQRSSLVVSCARLLLSLVASEAFLPWHPLALAAIVVFAALCFAAALPTLRSTPGISLPGGIVRSIFAFAIVLLLLIAVSGLGGKPRNGLLLVPVLASSAALAIATLRPRVQTAALILLAAWSALGTAHLLGRYGIAKASMNDRPEQVTAFIRQTAGGDCPVVVTYDAGLAFVLSQSRLPRLILLSGTGDSIFFSGQPQQPLNCTGARLFAVRSYLGEVNPWTDAQFAEMVSSTGFIQGRSTIDSFSVDPDAATKRRLANRDLAGAAQLPDYRYAVTSGPISPQAAVTMTQAMPDYLPSFSVTSPRVFVRP